MEKFFKYKLTQEEKHLLTKCANEVAQDCDCDCRDGCPFYLEHEDMCLLEKLEEIANESD